MTDLDICPGAGLGVVLVNYRCLDLIRARLADGAFDGAEVVLVDNGSDPDGVRVLADRYGAACILIEHNLGFAGGVNRALAAPWQDSTRAVLLLNPDVTVSAEQIRALAAALDGSDAAAVAPVVLDEDGRPWVSSAGGPVSLRSVIWYFLGLSHLAPALSGFFWTRRQVRNGKALRPAWLCGAVLLVRRSAWTDYGLLPEDELMYAEDVAWGARCTSAGGHLELVRSVEVVHSGGASGGSALWVGATARLFRRELGPIRGGLAAAVMRAGLAGRRGVRGALGSVGTGRAARRVRRA